MPVTKKERRTMSRNPTGGKRRKHKERLEHKAINF